jgi:hypothetical protein
VTGQRLPMREEPWPQGSNAARPCPICGKHWRPWAGSRLPCHAKCLYEPATLRMITEEVLSLADGMRTIARRMGLSYESLRSIVEHGRKVS